MGVFPRTRSGTQHSNLSASYSKPIGPRTPLPLRERKGPIASAMGGERLSVLSSGTCNLVSSVACFCVEPDQELVGEGDADDLLGFSRLAQPFVEGGEVGVVSADEIGDDEEDRADAVASAADGPFAEGLAAVASQRREAGALGGGFI